MANKNFVSTAMLCLSVFGCQENAKTDDTESTDQVESELGWLPPNAFVGEVKGVFSPPRVVSENPPTQFFLAQGQGTASQVGPFYLTIPHTFDVSTGRLVGQYYITPKINDGGRDVIMVEIDEMCAFTSPTAGSCDGTGTVTNGTGRYVAATGSITIHVDVDFATSKFEAKFNGTLVH